MDNLTIIIPAKKEKESLSHVLNDLEKLNIKTIVILERNDSETIKSIKNCKCEILYQIGKGYGDALIQGINNTKTKYFSIFNADGSFLSSELKVMYNLLQSNKCDFVFGSRYMPGGLSEDDTFITFVGNKIFTLIGNIFFSLNISDILYTFVMGNTYCAKNLDLREKRFSFCVELPIKAKRNGYALLTIPCHEKPRIGGKKKVNAFKDGFLILMSMIKLFFSSSKIK